MTDYTPAGTETFGGMDLRTDPQEVGIGRAAEALNVDFDEAGRVRSRDGYEELITLLARAHSLTIFATGSVNHIVLVRSNTLSAYNSVTLALVGSVTIGGVFGAWSFARIGTPTAGVLYAGTSNNGLVRWDGTSWFTTPTAVVDGVAASAYPEAQIIATTPDGRLAATGFLGIAGGPGGAVSSESYVYFSNAGTGAAWSTDNFVQLSPGDGQRIYAAVTWRDSLFIFKENKFFVFYGNTTDSTGGAIFNYRPVDVGHGTTTAAVAGRDGVYFINHFGVFVTSGDSPRRISAPIDPLFTGSLPPGYSGDAIDIEFLADARMVWANDRLYVAVTSTGSAGGNDLMLVWDSRTDAWMAWDIGAKVLAAGSIGVTFPDRVYFGYASGNLSIGQITPDADDDAGTAISSVYRSGLDGLGAPFQEKAVRQTRVVGTGSPSLSVLTDYGTSDSLAATVTLGSSSPDEGTHRVAYRGRLFGFKLAASSAWSASRAEFDVRDVRPPGMRSS